jgi:leader peptidase (prepilin peptidase)/N-methyltransferase
VKRLAGPAAVVVAAGLVAVTLVRYGPGWNGAAWSAVQVALVALAWVALRERRLPNAIVVPLGAAAIVLRAAFEHDALVEILVAGAIAFAVFLVLAVATRGGLGMGDVKLAAAEGLLFGKAAVEALLLGVVLGGVAAALLLVTQRAGRRATYAYGPYLTLGAAIAILAFRLPPLV